MLNKKQRFFFFFLFFLFFIFFANLTLAVEFRAPEINYPSLPFPGVDSPQVFLEKIQEGEISGEQALPLYVKYFYYLFLMIAGLLALGTMVYGGFLYLISAGAPVKMIAAREQITGGILGFVILLSSYLILATINPQLAIFRLPGLEKVTLPEIEITPLEKKVPTYFQVPTGMIIENAVLNEEAQEKLYSAYQTTEKIAKSAKDLYALSEKIHSLVMDADCGNSICRAFGCSATGCDGKDNQSQINTVIEKTPLAIEDLEEKTNEISIAKIPLINDLSQLGAAGLLMSLKYEEVFTYNDLLSIKHYYEEVEVTSFPDWENIDIKMDGQIVKDPVTFYLDKFRNEEEIYLASVLRLAGDAGLPPEPLGGWSEPPPAEPGKLQWPTATTEVTSGFGWRIHPIYGVLMFHNGIDISTNKERKPIYASADGIVVYRGYLGGYGNLIIISHDDLELSTAYAHLSSYNVAFRDEVKAGQRIAISDNTGTSTGHHLHFEVRNGLADNWDAYKFLQPLNPLNYLSKIEH